MNLRKACSIRYSRERSQVCSFQDVNDFELKEDGETVISGKLGGALVGGVLLGGI